MQWIEPDWPVPSHIKAISTTRYGGVSRSPYDSLNLGLHVEDNEQYVLANRQSLRETLELPGEPLWLDQVHSTTVADADSENPVLTADASVSRQENQICVVMTADCLPVLFTNKKGTVVAAAHAGWRGLHGGVLEATVSNMKVKPEDVVTWLGPAIGAERFEVGDDVCDAFVESNDEAVQAFVSGHDKGKWFADIYELARIRLNSIGVNQVYGGGCCTYSDKDKHGHYKFFSYRRVARTGRMASLIWINNN